MAKLETILREVIVVVTVKLPIEHAYTNSDIVETLKIKSAYTEIKVISVTTPED